MASAAYNYLMTTDKITYNDDDTFVAPYLGVDVLMKDYTDENGEERSAFNVPYVKQQFDNAAKTETNNSNATVDRLRQLFNDYPNYFLGSVEWMKLEHLPLVVHLSLSKFLSCAEGWLSGEQDWDTHFDELIYVRPEADGFKVGRTMNPYGRDAGYGSHFVYALVYVKAGSPAERAIKNMFWGRFIKTRGERVRIPDDFTANEKSIVYEDGTKYTDYAKGFNKVDRIIQAVYDCFDATSEYPGRNKDVAVDSSRFWFYDELLSEEENALRRNAFIKRFMPWAKTPKRSI